MDFQNFMKNRFFLRQIFKILPIFRWGGAGVRPNLSDSLKYGVLKFSPADAHFVVSFKQIAFSLLSFMIGLKKDKVGNYPPMISSSEKTNFFNVSQYLKS